MQVESGRFSSAPPSALSPASSGQVRSVTHTIEKRFILDLSALGYSPTRAIHLTYVPDDDHTNIGTLWLSNVDGTRTEILLEDPTTSADAGSVTGWMFGTLSLRALAAAQVPPPVFNEDGSYSPETARVLQFQLGTGDLKSRLNARQILVQSGDRSFRFIMDTLDGMAGHSSDRALRRFLNYLLLDSFSKVLDELKLRGERFPSEGHVKLARAFYEVSAYAAAAYHFAEGGDGVTGGEALDVAKRAYSYAQTERYAEAIQSFNKYLALDISTEYRAWARDALAGVYHKTGRLDEA